MADDWKTRCRGYECCTVCGSRASSRREDEGREYRHADKGHDRLCRQIRQERELADALMEALDQLDSCVPCYCPPDPGSCPTHGVLVPARTSHRKAREG